MAVHQSSVTISLSKSHSHSATINHNNHNTRFFVKNQVYAVGVGKAVVKDKGKTIKPSEALAICGWGHLKPMMLDPKSGISRCFHELEEIISQ